MSCKCPIVIISFGVLSILRVLCKFRWSQISLLQFICFSAYEIKKRLANSSPMALKVFLVVKLIA